MDMGNFIEAVEEDVLFRHIRRQILHLITDDEDGSVTESTANCKPLALPSEQGDGFSFWSWDYSCSWNCRGVSDANKLEICAQKKLGKGSSSPRIGKSNGTGVFIPRYGHTFSSESRDGL